MAGNGDQGQVRLAELVAALSLGVDLGFGQPMEHVLRQCLIALRLAERIGLDEDERAVVYYTALLVNVGCHADAYEQAKWFGDDIALKSGKYDHEFRSARAAMAAMRLIGSGNPPLHRFRVAVEFAVSGHRELDGMIESHTALARLLAEQLGLSAGVRDALGAAYETWDGRGWPGELEGAEIPVAARVAGLAEFVEVAHRMGGVGAAEALARGRSGTQFDPDLAGYVCADGELLFSDLDSVGTWDAVIAAEPALGVVLVGEEIDAALLAVANFVDLKSPYTLGHAAAVAELAADAAERAGLAPAEVSTLRRAGLVHDLGRLGVSNAIWDKEGPLGAGEWERIRLHPYLTERMLHSSPTLAPARCDRRAASRAARRLRLSRAGSRARRSRVRRGSSGRRMPTRRCASLGRTGLPGRPEEAAEELRAEVKAGRLEGDSVEAVLGAAGHRVSRRREGPAGLTAREVEVLRLLARGLSNKQIASQLVIAPKTVGNHVEHIYAKIGASTRAGASLFATAPRLVARGASAKMRQTPHAVSDAPP